MSNSFRKLQTTLKSRGLYTGAIDGIWGPMTEAGWEKYRKSASAPWPKVDAKFIEAVKAMAKRMGLPVDGYEWLMSCMSFETGGTFSPSIRNGAGSGACLSTNVHALGLSGPIHVDELMPGDLIWADDRETTGTILTDVTGITRKRVDTFFDHTVGDSAKFQSDATHSWYLEGGNILPTEMLNSVEKLPKLSNLASGDYLSQDYMPHLLQFIGVILLLGIFDELEDDVVDIRISIDNHIDVETTVTSIIAKVGVGAHIENIEVCPQYTNITVTGPSVLVAKEIVESSIYSTAVATGILEGLLETVQANGRNGDSIYLLRELPERELVNLSTHTDCKLKWHWSGDNLVSFTYSPESSELHTSKMRSDDQIEVWCPTTSAGNWIAYVPTDHTGNWCSFITGNCGLIQFMPSTAIGLGTTVDKLSKMSAIEQLTWVEKYFAAYRNRIKNLGDVYMSILWPSGIGKPDSYVLWSQSNRPTTYRQNAGLDLNKDSQITRNECLVKIREHWLAGYGI